MAAAALRHKASTLPTYIYFNHVELSREVESSRLEASVRQLAPHAVHVEVLLFKSPAQAAKYPPGSKVRTYTLYRFAFQPLCFSSTGRVFVLVVLALMCNML